MRKERSFNKLKREGYDKNRLFLKSQRKIEEHNNFEFYVTVEEKCNLDLRNYSDLVFEKKYYD